MGNAEEQKTTAGSLEPYQICWPKSLKKLPFPIVGRDRCFRQVSVVWTAGGWQLSFGFVGASEVLLCPNGQCFLMRLAGDGR